MIFSPIQGRMQKISQIVRLVFEIVLTDYNSVWVTKGLGTGPLPRPRNENWAKPQTNKNTKFHFLEVTIFERRLIGELPLCRESKQTKTNE